MFVGGVAVVLLWQVVGTSDYLGLGVPTILREMRQAGYAGSELGHAYPRTPAALAEALGRL